MPRKHDFSNIDLGDDPNEVFTPAALIALATGDNENFVAAATPGGIEAQEKRGQLAQALKQTLPKDLGRDASLFTACGFILGKPVDHLFIEATFPEGWKKVPTDHSMWSDIVDDQGRKRGAIFYKAAFYDQSAHAHLENRFSVREDYERKSKTDKRVYVHDARGIVEKEVIVPLTGDFRTDYDKKEEVRKELREWLTAEFPEWQHPNAYWAD